MLRPLSHRNLPMTPQGHCDSRFAPLAEAFARLFDNPQERGAADVYKRQSSMKAFLGLGKLVTLVFWGAVLVNLLHPFAYPLNWLLSIAGGLILLIHLIEILVLGRRLKARAHPWLDRLQVLLFGVFHMLALPALSPASELAQDKEDDHA